MNGPALDVALDLPLTRHISVGMGAYARELTARLPAVAPDLRFASFPHDRPFGLDEQVRLPLAMARARPRLSHFLSVYAPLAAPRPYLITIHDLIHLRFPHLFKSKVGPYYATVVRAVCAGARHVITDDDRTVGDLARFLGVPPAKTVVIPLGVDDVYLRDAEPLAFERPFFLYVGNHKPHKDLATLFAAWEALDPAHAVDLVLTGEDDLEAQPRPRREHGSLRFLGSPASPGLARYYRSAVALVHPALCEGFGLPLLEAAASGGRVIAASEAVPRVLRPYVETFAPRDVRALRALLERELDDPRPSEEARRFARTLTWDRCARATAQVYRETLAESEKG
ncbi:MAG: glycosyltransferase family 4 protein [Vulcanimicrobiaceae bacterium]